MSGTTHSKQDPFQRAPVRELSLDWINNTSDKILVDLLLKSVKYQESESYREQCHAVWNFLGFFGWSKNKCARLFNVDHKAFEKQISLPLDIQQPGRPKFLTESEINLLIEEVKRLIANGEYPTLYDMVQYIIENIQKSICPETIKNYLINSGFKIIIGHPMDENRAEVNADDIDNYYSNLAENINGTPASLVFNMDEAGEDDYVDTHSYNVIVQSDF